MIERYIPHLYMCWLYMYNFRVFVNRSLMLERVKFYGFDMDYTLASKWHKKGKDEHDICVRSELLWPKIVPVIQCWQFSNAKLCISQCRQFNYNTVQMYLHLSVLFRFDTIYVL